MKLNKSQKRFVKYFSESINIINSKYFTRLYENNRIEFKKSFVASTHSISKSYLKTIASFANNNGGWIIFGVTPDENEIVGIKSKYENLDNAIISTAIRDGIDGTFVYDFFTTKINGRIIGFLKIEKALNPPVIIKQYFEENGIKIQTGDIFYRYSAQSTRITATDLRQIIDNEIAKKAKAFLSKVQQIIKIGPENTTLLDNKTGEINSENTNVKLILSEDILDKINFIKEGKLVNKNGAPAYIVKGKIESIVQPTEIIEKPIATGIRAKDYYSSFFSFRCPNPKIFIKELLYRESHYYPIYFFMQKAKLNVNETINYLESLNEPEIKNNIKLKLIQRLKDGDIYSSIGALIETINENYFLDNEEIETQLNNIANKYGLKGNRNKTIFRTIIVNMLLEKKSISNTIINYNLIGVIQAFSHLDSSFIKKNRIFLLNELQKISQNITRGNAASYFRKVICKYDYILFGRLGV